jgi:hypothetical protein
MRLKHRGGRKLIMTPEGATPLPKPRCNETLNRALVRAHRWWRMQRHRHQEFLRFLNAVEAAVPAGKLIHAILDNYGSHKHPQGPGVAR